jgi:flagellar hook-associated protein FlgK
LITNIGSYLSDIKRSHDNSKEIHNEIEDKLNEIIGVDTNEEFVSLLSYQRMLESSSKYLSIINHLFDSILEILK